MFSLFKQREYIAIALKNGMTVDENGNFEGKIHVFPSGKARLKWINNFQGYRKDAGYRVAISREQAEKTANPKEWIWHDHES